MGIFSNPRAVSCRLCGATHAYPGRGGLCATCCDQFVRSNGFREPTDDELDLLLAEALVRQAVRVKRLGFSRRCEHITTAGNRIDAKGYQCAMWAKNQVNGRYLCHAHSKRDPEKWQLTDAAPENGYKRFAAILADICSRDADFRECLLDAIEASK